MTRTVAPHVSTVLDGPAYAWVVFWALYSTCLYLCGISEVAAVTLVNPGTDITPAGASDIASSTLNILTNYVSPLGGLGMLAGAGASFARNRQSGITAGPAAMGIGGTAMIFAPTLTSQLMTSAATPAPLMPLWNPVEVGFSPSPVLIVSYLLVRTLRRHWHVAGMSLAAK